MKRRNWLTLAAVTVMAFTAAVFAEETTPAKTAPAAKATQPVKGNPDSKVYHKPACRYYKSKSSTKVFKSEAEAVKAGYKPCKRCAASKKDKKAKQEKKEETPAAQTKTTK